jgi:hypothetical protein
VISAPVDVDIDSEPFYLFPRRLPFLQLPVSLLGVGVGLKAYGLQVEEFLQSLSGRIVEEGSFFVVWR